MTYKTALLRLKTKRGFRTKISLGNYLWLARRHDGVLVVKYFREPILEFRPNGDTKIIAGSVRHLPLRANRLNRFLPVNFWAKAKGDQLLLFQTPIGLSNVVPANSYAWILRDGTVVTEQQQKSLDLPFHKSCRDEEGS